MLEAQEIDGISHPLALACNVHYCNKLGNIRTCYLKRKIGTHGVHVLARSRSLRTCCTVN